MTILAAVALLVATLGLMSTGRLTIDTGLGRRTRPLGPQTVRIAAPRETVFDQIAVPYLSAAPPRELRDKISVLERGTDMVVAAHRTRSGWITTVTVESVSFQRPSHVAFRLLRGPVPSVTELFVLREIDAGSGTELEYTGELATDFWALGSAWGDFVAHYWERAVASSLGSLKGSCERPRARAAAP